MLPPLDYIRDLDAQSKITLSAVRRSHAQVMQVSADYAAAEAKVLGMHKRSLPPAPVAPQPERKVILPPRPVKQKRVTYKWPWRKVIAAAGGVIMILAALSLQL